VQEVPRALPGIQTDLAALQQTYETAKTAAAQAKQTQQKAEATATTLRAQHQTIEQDLADRTQQRQGAQQRFVERFPGFSSLSAALSGLQSQRQEISSRLKKLEAEVQGAENEKQRLEQQRGKAQQEEATLNEALRRITQQIETASGHLSTLATTLAAYLAVNEDPETELSARRAVLVQEEQEVKALEQTWRKEEQTLSALRTKKLQSEGQLGVVTTERNAAASQTEREAQATREILDLTTEAPLPTLVAVQQQLEDLAQKEARHAVVLQRQEQLHQEHAQAERRAVELQAELQARHRAVAETQQAVQQAENTLATVRVALQTALQQSELPDLGAEGEHLRARVDAMHGQLYALQEQRGRLETEIADLERRCTEKAQEEEKLRAAENETRLAAELRKLLGAEFTDYLSEGAVKALMHDASAHLQKLTHGRYSFRIDYKPGKRGAIELLIVDHEDSQRARPTHSLSGGETFLASLAIALALSQSFREIATGKAAKTSTECLILDEGFGTLDREGVQLVTETLQELRGEEGRMVGIITHVEEVAAAMPMRIEVRKGNRTSTLTVSG
jgi:exonuclease SbcC